MANTSLTKVKTWTADGNSTVVQWPGGLGQMVACGTWGGGTITLEMSPDDETTWLAIGGDSTVTTDACVNFDLNACDLRLVLAGSDGSFSLDGYLTETIRDGVWGKGIMHCPN